MFVLVIFCPFVHGFVKAAKLAALAIVLAFTRNGRSVFYVVRVAELPGARVGVCLVVKNSNRCFASVLHYGVFVPLRPAFF